MRILGICGWCLMTHVIVCAQAVTDRPQDGIPKQDIRSSADSQPAEAAPDIYAALNYLERVSYDYSTILYGGNGYRREALTVLNARYASTPYIIIKIKSTNNTNLIKVLYYFMGMIKDPATIEWLQRNMIEEEHGDLYRDWLDGWKLMWITPRSLKLIDDRDRWVDFLIALFRKHVKTEEQLRLDRYVPWARQDRRVVEFYKDLLAKQEIPSKPFLECCAYLYEQGQISDVDSDDINKSVNYIIAKDPSACLEIGSMLPNKILINWMIDRLGAGIDKNGQNGINYALHRLTLRNTITSKEEWVEWYRLNEHKTQNEWHAARLQEIDELVKKDIHAAKKLLKDMAHVWRCDSAVSAGYLNRWCRNEMLYNECVQLMCEESLYNNNKVYSESINQILSKDMDALSEESINMLKEADYLADPDLTLRKLIEEMQELIEKISSYGESNP